MTQTDSSADVTANAGYTIALIINLPEAVKYLDGNNLILQAQYGQRLLRKMVQANRDVPVAWELLYPETDPDAHRKLATLELLERFPDVPRAQLQEFLVSDRFYTAVLQEILIKCGLGEEFCHEVRVIIAETNLWEETYPLREVCRRYFPNASLFAAEQPGHTQPEPVISLEVGTLSR